MQKLPSSGRQVFLCLLLLCCSLLTARADDNPVFPPPPRLATTTAELAAIKDAPDFPAKHDAAIKAGDELVAHPVEIPDGYGEWIFYYACPDDGTALQPLSPKKHKCPQCGKVYADDRTVAAYRCKLHYEAEYACEKLGWAYAYSGDAKYAAGVKRILLKLAHDYPSYPARRDRWGNIGIFAPLGGRRYVQSLDEAVGIIRLAKGYDLTRNDAIWSADERALVERDLFGLTAHTLLMFNQGINNHQTWYNAGLMAIASVRGDAQLARCVLDMPGGYRDQLQHSLGDDGLWYEGTMAYHNYALQAMLELVNAGRRIGLNVQNEPRLKALIAAPLHAAYPNGQFPAFNDSDPANIAMFDSAFQWAWDTWHDPIYARALARNDPELLKKLLGPDAKPGSPLPDVSESLPDAGLTILRSGKGADANCVFLKWGPHGGGHGHFDKLGITLYANGREWLLDPGRLDYSHKEYKTWVKETAAHNTVAINGGSQQATTGQLLYLQSDKDYSACAAESDAAYPDVHLRRYLLLADKFLIDVFEVAGKQEMQIDWFAHSNASRLYPINDMKKTSIEKLGDTDGYQHLLTPAIFKTAGIQRWAFGASVNNTQTPCLGVWLSALQQDREEVFTATGIGYYVNEKAPCLVRRRNEKATRFVTVYDLSGNNSGVSGVTILPGDKAGMLVTTHEGKYEVNFNEKSAACRRN